MCILLCPAEISASSVVSDHPTELCEVGLSTADAAAVRSAFAAVLADGWRGSCAMRARLDNHFRQTVLFWAGLIIFASQHTSPTHQLTLWTLCSTIAK
ncbi:unnamed protein product [Protopolystoma xenopodis]|uniref:Uncharacterized protein n=1 Tax=Protopolystoma xenopodis TaxID=117903 RepID=A0A3S5B6V7_9PLAT|nr:unnamed protein product [Protopolystoma xenopodis]